MQNILRSMLLAGAATFGLAALAQPYTVTVSGHISPCNPAIAGSPVTVENWGVQPPQTITAIANANCYYTVDVEVTSTTGVFLVSASCGNGMMVSDSVSYSVTPPGPVQVTLDLNGCGSTSTCAADFTVQQAMNGSTPVPWTITTTNLSTGTPSLSFHWWLPDGSSSTEAEPGFTFNAPGVYGFCLTVIADGTCTATLCDSLVVDIAGLISTNPAWFDCLGELWGPATPGTPCDDGNPATMNDTWHSDCSCAGTPAPGCHACIITAQDSTPAGIIPFTALFSSCSTGEAPLTYLWDFGNGSTSNMPNPQYQYSGPGTYLTCLTITDNSGCTSFTCDTLVIDANGTISPFPTPDCEAGFWTIQAYDSTAGGVTPIPNEVWVWNLSSGGNGNYQFQWSFGDGTGSTDPFPTHTYSGPGPWLLCLTMHSGNCTDTYCDSVSVDEDGILNGMMTDGHGTSLHERSGGFTLNVIQQQPTGIAETAAITDLKTWPNPVDDLLHIAFHNRRAGEMELSVTDPLGRAVLSQQLHLGSGSNLLQVPTDQLAPGLYIVRIGQGPQGITQRFLKVR